ncbi:hypothetical protein GCM10009801_37530 [Streptomyces albiaxialis]|uniref:Uncharacterized protein n=1 Tax=Streptomyces albiaxialis TaxID=329523 RepID=A0ABP5HLZ4_9ACTN
MTVHVFRCVRCQGEVTGPVREVRLPDVDDAPVPYSRPDGEEECPPRVGPGVFALDPPREPRATGTVRLPAGLAGVVLARADVRGVRLHPGRGRRNGCCGLDGCDGPNLVCATCGTDMATEQSDCWTPQQVTLLPGAVALVPV